MEKKAKRFYKVDEVVWVIAEKKEGKILSIDKAKLEAVVKVEDKELTVKMWDIDKLKYKAKDKFFKDHPEKAKKGKLVSGSLEVIDVAELHRKVQELYNTIMHPEVFFAKVRPEGIIPSKRKEDAGWDFYACVEPREVDGEDVFEIYLPAFKTTLVPTGVASALPTTHYLNTKHERGSTAKPSVSVLAGVIDSGYRDEIFLALTPLHKDVLITSEVDKIEYQDNVILYPYSKAVAQGTIDLVVEPIVKEISFNDLQKIESERGTTKLGQSGK